MPSLSFSDRGIPLRIGVITFRRQLAWGIAAVAAGLVVATGLAFLQTNGTATASVTTGNATGEVYTSNPTSVPTNFPTVWYCGLSTGTAADTATTGCGTTATTGPDPAGWSPAASSTGSITTSGDLAIIDATNGPVMVTIALTNAADMSSDYSYFNMPIELASWTPGTSTSWTTNVKDANSVGEQYLNLTDGYVTYDLPQGDYYEVYVPTGGSYYCVSTSTASGGSLTPTFDIAATPLG
jgi:hypothetical protein